MKDKLDLGEGAQQYHDYFNAQTEKRLKILLSRCKSNLFKQMIMAIQEKRLQLEDQDMFENMFQ